MDNFQQNNIILTDLDLCINAEQNIADMNDIHLTPNELALSQTVGDTVESARYLQSALQPSVQRRKPGRHVITGENVVRVENNTTMQVVSSRNKNVVKHYGRVFLWNALNEALRVAAVRRSLNFVFAVYLPRPIVIKTGQISALGPIPVARILPP
ncbi:unnamed protein product [Macrosiphum euphorbiae]|uniref:Transposase n=1 Tax=Macrosiphum euphorbiae TaxID=13131 RepID=A0AAV0WBA1_9HEMI|nr:unnamed protein product [Macrosiphum euphorbiae]